VPTYEAFLSTGDQAAEIPQTTDVAFCGNLYLDQTRRDPCFREPALESVVAGMVRRKLADLGRSNWDLLCEELDRLSPRTRDRLGLYPGRRAFWEFYIAAIWTAMNTHPRMEILKRIPRRVRMFGLFSEHASRELLQEYPNLEFAGQLDQFRELPMQFAATRVNICLSNGLIQRGTPSKLIDCLASGGFALCDPKADLMRLFGPKVKAIFCRNSDEFNAKIDYFLSKPKERREIVEALRRDIRKHCTLRAFYERALGLVREQRRAWSSKARSAA
jgi:spore maturation protein CgeB